MSVARLALICLVALVVTACATLPPGSSFPKTVSTALSRPEQTRLGRQFQLAARTHGGESAFRLVPVGVNGFLVRAQMINKAERTLDLEYFIFRQDDTGQLLTDALLHAADRGVRVRVLVDDGDTLGGDEQITALGAHPNIAIRIFNPFAYRGHDKLLRAAEFLFDSSRLDYRMHNKLLVADNAIALVGGRNIGDRYFQVDPDSQFGDDDVFAAGPIVRPLSRSFDAFWNSPLAIPVRALEKDRVTSAALAAYRKKLDEHRRQLKADGLRYAKRVTSGEPLDGMLSGALPLVWAKARVVYDSPEKKLVEDGEIAGRLMHPDVVAAAEAVHSELLIVTPFLIPGRSGMRLIPELCKRGVRIRILTNSLESTPELLAQSGYMPYRVPLLEDGVELYEVRALPGKARGSGESRATELSGSYALHAKLFVFDRKSLYVGSMNFDLRSRSLNTEIGLIIDSPVLATQVAVRFDAIVVPANSYRVVLRPAGASGSPQLAWRTVEDGKPVEYRTEPARSAGQRIEADLLSLLPLDDEL